MKLTGKCAEAFKEWSKDKGIDVFYAKDYSLNTAKTIHNSILIDFFDSVGIYIITVPNFGWGFEIYIDSEVEPIVLNCDYNTRIESTNAAIVITNEIFNNR